MLTELFHHMELRTGKQMLQKKRAFEVTERTMANRDHAPIGNHPKHVCMYVTMYVCMYVCTYVRTYVCMYVCMYVRTYVRTYVLMYLLKIYRQ